MNLAGFFQPSFLNIKIFKVFFVKKRDFAFRGRNKSK